MFNIFSPPQNNKPFLWLLQGIKSVRKKKKNEIENGIWRHFLKLSLFMTTVVITWNYQYYIQQVTLGNFSHVSFLFLIVYFTEMTELTSP